MMASLKSHATVTPSWRQYEVDENETLLSISVKVCLQSMFDCTHIKTKFDTSADIIKRKNKIRDTSELWMGRVILVPENTGIPQERVGQLHNFEQRDLILGDEIITH